jgi:nitric oxide reductase large subunit
MSGQRLFFLMLLDGLAVSLARAFIERHSFASIGEFFLSWFIHLFAIGLFAVFAGACIMRFRKFWLTGALHVERDWTNEEILAPRGRDTTFPIASITCRSALS